MFTGPSNPIQPGSGNHCATIAVELSELQCQQRKDHAAALDRGSVHHTGNEPLRIAFLVPEAALYAAIASVCDQAYVLGQAGHQVWLVSQGAMPEGGPVDLRKRCQWVRLHAGRPWHEAFPPCDLVVATQWEQGVALWAAGRPFVFFTQEMTGLAPDLWWLPARVMVASSDLAKQIQGICGRPVWTVSPGGQLDTLPNVGMWIEAAAACVRDPVGNGRPRVSLCMIVKNEAEHIAASLTSAYGVVDEICVVDTGSTDNTVDIARRLGATVTFFPWQDDFSAARNASLAMATGDWVLQLDADERLTPEIRAAMPGMVRDPEAVSYLMPVDSPTPGGVNRVYARRLFRRLPGVHYRGRIHEHLDVSFMKKAGRVPVMQLPIFHLGYTEDPMMATGKRSRNRHLLLLAREEEPDNPRHQYYLAVEEYLSGDPHAALELLERLPPASWLQGEPSVLTLQSYHLMGQWRKALEIARKGTRQYPNVHYLWIFQATLAKALGDEDACLEAIRMLEDPSPAGIGDAGLARSVGAYLRGSLTHDRNEAERLWRGSLPLGGRALRPLLRHWITGSGLDYALKEVAVVPGESGWRVRMVLQALIDLQDWSGMVRALEREPAARQEFAVGSLLWSQGYTDQAVGLWQTGGSEGWLRYGIVAALFGEPADLEPALSHVSPLEGMALADLQSGAESWRPAVLVPALMDMGLPSLVGLTSQRCPVLNEAIQGYYALYVAPGGQSVQSSTAAASTMGENA